jgi:hypothetical protein
LTRAILPGFCISLDFHVGSLLVMLSTRLHLGGSWAPDCQWNPKVGERELDHGAAKKLGHWCSFIILATFQSGRTLHFFRNGVCPQPLHQSMHGRTLHVVDADARRISSVVGWPKRITSSVYSEMEGIMRRGWSYCRMAMSMEHVISRPRTSTASTKILVTGDLLDEVHGGAKSGGHALH